MVTAAYGTVNALVHVGGHDEEVDLWLVRTADLGGGRLGGNATVAHDWILSGEGEGVTARSTRSWSWPRAYRIAFDRNKARAWTTAGRRRPGCARRAANSAAVVW